MYHDYYLRFDDEAAARAVLFDEQANGEEIVMVPRYDAIDIIGTIYKPTGKTLKTPEGPVPEMAPLEGFHANVRHRDVVPELDAYAVQPRNPSRMWA